MKKIFIVLFLIFTSFCFAETFEWNWSTYEKLCNEYNKEPSWEEFVELSKDGRCIYISEDDEKELDKIMKNN